MCSKLTKTPDRCYWHWSGVFIVKFEHISHRVILFLLLNSTSKSQLSNLIPSLTIFNLIFPAVIANNQIFSEIDVGTLNSKKSIQLLWRLWFQKYYADFITRRWLSSQTWLFTPFSEDKHIVKKLSDLLFWLLIHC